MHAAYAFVSIELTVLSSHSHASPALTPGIT